MSRRWFSKQAQQRLEHLISYDDFVSGLPEYQFRKGGAWDASGQLADHTDVYSVYSALYAKGYNPVVSAASTGNFLYLLLPRPASLAPQVSQSAQQVRCVAVPCVSVHNKCQQDGQLVEPIVPVSVSCQCLDFARLSCLGQAVPEQPGYVKLAFVDTDGTVTISKLHGGIHMPEEKLLASEEPDAAD